MEQALKGPRVRDPDEGVNRDAFRPEIDADDNAPK